MAYPWCFNGFSLSHHLRLGFVTASGSALKISNKGRKEKRKISRCFDCIAPLITHFSSGTSTHRVIRVSMCRAGSTPVVFNCEWIYRPFGTRFDTHNTAIGTFCTSADIQKSWLLRLPKYNDKTTRNYLLYWCSLMWATNISHWRIISLQTLHWNHLTEARSSKWVGVLRMSCGSTRGTSAWTVISPVTVTRMKASGKSASNKTVLTFGVPHRWHRLSGGLCCLHHTHAHVGHAV